MPILLLFFGLFLMGCSNVKNVYYDFTDPPTINKNVTIEKTPLFIGVQPLDPPSSDPSAIILPVQMEPILRNYKRISLSLSKQIWQTWLAQSVFSTLEYDDSLELYSVNEALIYAKKKKATLLVRPTSNFFLDGSTLGRSNIALTIEIYDVASGMLLWSLQQDASLSRTIKRDFIVFSVEDVLPQNPIGTMVADIASEMGRKIKLWRKNEANFISQPSNTPTAF
ncbi:MAG: hypothetical protein ACRCV3_03190 [Desulfovibrionaceae bacterium]